MTEDEKKAHRKLRRRECPKLGRSGAGTHGGSKRQRRRRQRQESRCEEAWGGICEPMDRDEGIEVEPS